MSEKIDQYKKLFGDNQIDDSFFTKKNPYQYEYILLDNTLLDSARRAAFDLQWTLSHTTTGENIIPTRYPIQNVYNVQVLPFTLLPSHVDVANSTIPDNTARIKIYIKELDYYGWYYGADKPFHFIMSNINNYCSSLDLDMTILELNPPLYTLDTLTITLLDKHNRRIIADNPTVDVLQIPMIIKYKRDE